MGLFGDLPGVVSIRLRQCKCKLVLAGGGQHPSGCAQCCAGLGWQNTTFSSVFSHSRVLREVWDLYTKIKAIYINLRLWFRICFCETSTFYINEKTECPRIQLPISLEWLLPDYFQILFFLYYFYAYIFMYKGESSLAKLQILNHSKPKTFTYLNIFTYKSFIYLNKGSISPF